MNNMLGQIGSGLVTAVTQAGAAVVSVTPTPVANVVNFTLGAFGYVPASQVDALRANRRMTPQEAFDAAAGLEITDYEQVKKYYGIVLASTNLEDSVLQFRARCTLAWMTAHLPFDNVTAEPDDNHNVILQRAKEVKIYLYDIYQEDPSAYSYKNESEIEYVEKFSASLTILRGLISRGLNVFKENHERCSFEKREAIKNRWELWKTILAGTNTMHRWLKIKFPDVVTEDDSISEDLISRSQPLQETLVALYSSEITRLNELYRRKANGFDLDVFYAELNAVGEMLYAEIFVGTTQHPCDAYAALMGDVAKELAMTIYRPWKEQIGIVQLDSGARNELVRAQNYFIQAGRLKLLEGFARDACNEVMMKILSLDEQYAKGHPVGYLIQCKQELMDYSFFIKQIDKPEEILQQIEWLKSKRAIILAVGVGEHQAVATPLLETIKLQLEKKEKFLQERVQAIASNKSEELISVSLGMKRAISKGMGAGVMRQSPEHAQLLAEQKTLLKQALTDILSDMDVMRSFYAATPAERLAMDAKVQNILVANYSYAAYSNSISVRNKQLDDAAINTIKADLKGPEVVVRRRLENV